MKVKSIFIILLSLSMCSIAPAQTNSIRRFLEGYAPLKQPYRAGRIFEPPASLRSMAQNGAVPLTTADVIRLLLENNRDVVVSRLAPVSSLYLTRSLERPFEPNLNVIGLVSHITSPSSTVLAGAGTLTELLYDYRVRLDQTFQTGTTYSIEFLFNRFSTNSLFYVYNPAYNGTVRYNVTQHMLRDFGRQVNSRQIRIARNNEKISELQFELDVIDLVTEALQSYWDLVFAAEDVKVKQRSLDLASKTLRDNQIQVQVGTLASIDLVQAEAEVATRTEDLITARYGTDELQDQMKKLISSETDPAIVLTQLSLIEPVRQPGSETLRPLAQAIQFALENRPEMRQSDYDLQNQEINIQYAKNQMRPILDITAGYTHLGLGGTQTVRSGLEAGAEIIQVIPGGVGEMFRSLASFNFPGYTASFTLQIPLRNRAARADYDRALNERELSERRKASIAQRIALEVRNAYTQVDMNRARVATARTARELASRRLDAEEKKFDLGASTVRFVLEEQRNLAQAETNQIEALVNFTKALVATDRAMGNTLARNNIEFEKQLPKQLTSGN